MDSSYKHKILVIVGPTASGKSDLAVTLAKRFTGEVISADSRQVYKGLDIGSGKITTREMGGVPHYLLDVRSPRSVFSVHDFMRLAERAVADITARGKLPIIAGGTGFYIDALVYGRTFPEVPPNATLRKELETKSTDVLFATLEQLDPERAADIDPHNAVRLIRAIEIATALGSVPKATPQQARFDTCFIGVTWPDAVLKERIAQRLETRIKRGMVAEVKQLHQNGLSWKRMEALGLEYRYLARYLRNLITKEQLLTELAAKIWQYAKRQKMWFKRNKEITWFTPTDTEAIERHIQSWLQSRSDR